MPVSRSSSQLLAAVTLLAGGLLAGCSGSVSVGDETTVDADQVAGRVSDQLEQRVGRAPDSVDCPDDLDAEVGATVRCTLTDGETQLGVDVTVTEVDGDTVRFSVQVDDQPKG